MDLQELKEKFLRLLERDKEFRYIVAARLGLLEILERFQSYDEKFNKILEEIRELRQKSVEHDKRFHEILNELKGLRERSLEHDRKFSDILARLAEHDRKFNEIVKRLDEHDRKFSDILARLAEHDRKFNEIVKRLDEHDRKFSDILARLAEHDRKFNEIVKRLDEHDRKFNEIMAQIRDMKLMLDRLAVSLEDEAMEVIRYFLKQRGIHIDLSALYFNSFEMNIYGATDNICVLGEVGVRVGVSKIKELLKKVSYLRIRAPNYLRDNVILVLYGVRILPEAVERAKKYNIWLLTATKELTPFTKLRKERLSNLKYE